MDERGRRWSTGTSNGETTQRRYDGAGRMYEKRRTIMKGRWRRSRRRWE